MNSEQYHDLIHTEPRDQVIWAHSILGRDRTLLFGYTCERETWHVYLKDRKIHLLVYVGGVAGLSQPEPIRHDVLEKVHAVDLIPDKRVYPESTDAGFAIRLKRLGVQVPYRRFDENRYELVRDLEFHGRIAD